MKENVWEALDHINRLGYNYTEWGLTKPRAYSGKHYGALKDEEIPGRHIYCYTTEEDIELIENADRLYHLKGDNAKKVLLIFFTR